VSLSGVVVLVVVVLVVVVLVVVVLVVVVLVVVVAVSVVVGRGTARFGDVQWPMPSPPSTGTTAPVT